VAFGVKETVLGFEVAVDDSLGVERTECEEYFRDIECSDVLREHAFCIEMIKEFASRGVLQLARGRFGIPRGLDIIYWSPGMRRKALLRRDF
jgi:hypothetical protein